MWILTTNVSSYILDPELQKAGSSSVSAILGSDHVDHLHPVRGIKMIVDVVLCNVKIAYRTGKERLFLIRRGPRIVAGAARALSLGAGANFIGFIPGAGWRSIFSRFSIEPTVNFILLAAGSLLGAQGLNLLLG